MSTWASSRTLGWKMVSCGSPGVRVLAPTWAPFAVYNACDDHVSDGMDAFEAALKATLRALPMPSGGNGAAAAGARKPVAGVEIAEVGEVRIISATAATLRSDLLRTCLHVVYFRAGN